MKYNTDYEEHVFSY